MKARYVMFGAGMVICMLGLSLWIPSAIRSLSDDQPADAVAHAQQGTGAPGSDDSPEGPTVVIIPERYRPQSGISSSAATAASVASVWFTPQDQSTSTTLLFLYNTGGTEADVGLTTYTTAGGVYLDTSITVPAHALVRICADPVAPIGGSWQEAIYTNFTTSSAYAKLALPAGIKAEGYVAWNGGSNYDPLQAVPTLSLRFSTDPPTVFLPLVERE